MGNLEKNAENLIKGIPEGLITKEASIAATRNNSAASGRGKQRPGIKRKSLGQIIASGTEKAGMIGYVENPGKEAALAAVKQNPGGTGDRPGRKDLADMIRHIKNADKEVVLAAVKQNPGSTGDGPGGRD